MPDLEQNCAKSNVIFFILRTRKFKVNEDNNQLNNSVIH